MLLKNSLFCALVFNIISYISTPKNRCVLSKIAWGGNIIIHQDFHQTKHITTIKFDKIVHDFGSINQQGTQYTFFNITNTGKHPLVIEKIDASCGCTKVTISKKRILPGKSARINVHFHPMNNEKSFQKVIAIVANTQPRISLLTIQGKIINN
jgi:hypothetical protein